MEGRKREGGGGMPPRPKFVSLFHFFEGAPALSPFFSPSFFAAAPRLMNISRLSHLFFPQKEGGREEGGKGKGKHMQETEQKGRGTKKCLFPPPFKDAGCLV